MPFDGVTSRPTLEMLSTILRDRGLWPQGFEWSYKKCETCAMGLLEKLAYMHVPMKTLPLSFDENFKYPDHFGATCQLFSLTVKEGSKIFVDLGKIRGKSNAVISPEEVADAIDTYLATQKQLVLAA